MKNLQNIFATTKKTFKQYPLVLLSAFVCFVCIIGLIEYKLDNLKSVEIESTFTILSKIAFTTSWGISVFFAMKVLTERLGRALLINGIGVGLLLFFYFAILPTDFAILPTDFERDPHHTVIIRIVVCYILSHLAVAFFPFISAKNGEYPFWEYNKNLFLNFCNAAIFTFVLSGGIILAMFSISQLFDITVSERFYVYVGIFSGTFGSCFIFLSFCRNLAYLETIEHKYPIVLKFFTQFVLIPLLILYGLILYLYGLKIFLSWTLPRGWVSFMIMAYSVVGLLAYLLVSPLGKTNAKSWVKLFFKLFHFSLLPLLVLLFVAIFTRVLQYGFTENRYFIVLFAVWLAFITFYFTIWKKSDIRFIPISLFVFILGSVSLPFFNTFSVSKWSQKRGLERLLSEAKVLENGKINFDKAIADTMAQTISEKISFLAERDEKDYLMNFIPKKSKVLFAEELNSRYISEWEIKRFFTNIIKTKDNSDDTTEAIVEQVHYWDIPHSTSIPKGFSTMVYLDYNNISINKDNVEINTDITENKSTFFLNLSNGDTLKYDLFNSLKQQMEGKTPSPKVEFTLGQYDFVFIPKTINYYEEKGEITEINIYKGVLFYKIKP